MNQPIPSTRQAINLFRKLDLIAEQWSPRVVAEMNDYQFKVARLQGDFIWHAHAETDEAFLVLDGQSVSYTHLTLPTTPYV